ncbi:hypothetical protein ACNQF7_10210 [Flavobacterium sp. RSP29]|uniref:hypothetical protein n=1 Tax=Flavobacterium sp. RSP29 TaxID=3401731 RepID=UPI003AAE7471
MSKKYSTEEFVLILFNKIDTELSKVSQEIKEIKERNERMTFDSVFLKDDLDDKFDEELLKSRLSEKYNCEVDLRIMGDYYKYQLIMRFK